ncbi:hypothetical protein L484_006936 [Morus notabilis]|uniref:Uncharacterized protein n=1 Tax=Morus notabilis TaxID=981085 RepID=W9QDI0_9ROSA|nr:hypothetical protein L484_006936 [Morus notabilis]
MFLVIHTRVILIVRLVKYGSHRFATHVYMSNKHIQSYRRTSGGRWHDTDLSVGGYLAGTALVSQLIRSLTCLPCRIIKLAYREAEQPSRRPN